MGSEFAIVSSPRPDFKRILLYSVFFFAPFRDLRVLSILSIQDISILLLFIMVIFDIQVRPLKSLITNFLLLSIFLTIVITLQSSIVASDPISSALNVMKIFLTFCLLPIVILYFQPIRSELETLLKCFIFGAGTSCFGAILFDNGLDFNTSGRSSGFAGHPVFFGILTGMAISFAIVFLFLDKRHFLTMFPSVIVMTLGLTLSASSIGIFLPIVALLIILFNDLTRLNLRRLTLGLIFLTLSAYAFMNFQIFAFSKSRLLQTLNPTAGFSTNRISGTSTLQARVVSIQSGFEKIGHSPILGNGFDSAGRVTSVNLEPHNFLILAWQTGGIIVLCLAIILVVISIMSGLRAVQARMVLDLTVLSTSWFALLTSPLLYERSVVTPLLLICTFWYVDRRT